MDIRPGTHTRCDEPLYANPTGANTPISKRREVCHSLAWLVALGPRHRLLDLDVHRDLRAGRWIGVEPLADRMGSPAVDPSGIPAQLHLHHRLLAGCRGRRDHRPEVPA